MTFSRRITLFLIGLFFGTVLVYYTLGDNDRLRFNWLPNSRVVNRIADKLDTTNIKNQCFTQCAQLSFDELKQKIIAAEVNFDSSLAQQQPPQYQIDFDDDELANLKVILRERAAVIQSIAFTQTKQDCNCRE